MMYVQVPDERIELLKSKNTKSTLESQTGVSINIDSDLKTVSIEHKESAKEYQMKEVLNAFSTGFDTHTSLKLFKDESMMFEKINIKDILRNRKEIKRQKGRLIGKNGKTRNIIEKLSNVSIRIYGNKVGIIGNRNSIRMARESIIKLLHGCPHSQVYASLEKFKKETRLRKKKLNMTKLN